VWNVASGRRTTIVELADTVERAAGVELARRHDTRREGDVRDSAVSPSRLRGLGWRPTVPLARGVAQLVDFERTRAGR
jgi:nucleoside-diphosphate-sugar epimerase